MQAPRCLLHYHERWPQLPGRLLLLQLFMCLKHLAQVVKGRKHCVPGIIAKPGDCATEKWVLLWRVSAVEEDVTIIKAGRPDVHAHRQGAAGVGSNHRTCIRDVVAVLVLQPARNRRLPHFSWDLLLPSCCGRCLMAISSGIVCTTSRSVCKSSTSSAGVVPGGGTLAADMLLR